MKTNTEAEAEMSFRSPGNDAAVEFLSQVSDSLFAPCRS